MTKPVLLTREVRFQLVADRAVTDSVINSWAGSPKTRFMAPFVTLRCTVNGPVADATGYVADVKFLDQVVRDTCITDVSVAYEKAENPESLVLRLSHAVADALRPVRLHSLELQLTPYLRLSIFPEASDVIVLTQQFEFSAAHRLHNASLSDEENRRLFGKCNNPNGHGHNYVVDVSLRRDDADFDLAAFERTVRDVAIRRFDHQHLNHDMPEFADLNPTVENIVAVIWRLLEPVVPGLETIRVYETPKTWAEVSAGSD